MLLKVKAIQKSGVSTPLQRCKMSSRRRNDYSGDGFTATSSLSHRDAKSKSVDVDVLIKSCLFK